MVQLIRDHDMKLALETLAAFLRKLEITYGARKAEVEV
jgi:hypothetical protein